MYILLYDMGVKEKVSTKSVSGDTHPNMGTSDITPQLTTADNFNQSENLRPHIVCHRIE